MRSDLASRLVWRLCSALEALTAALEWLGWALDPDRDAPAWPARPWRRKP